MYMYMKANQSEANLLSDLSAVATPEINKIKKDSDESFLYLQKSSSHSQVCEMCGEQFENFFDEDSEEWRLRDAIRVGNKTYHPACYEDVGEVS